jgi:antitoxin CptB
MRELDLLLLAFLERGYDAMDGAMQARFEGLLENPDQILFEWLLGHSVPSDMEVLELVEYIRRCVMDGD